MTALHWETTGTGEPVLMITGLGLSGGAWWRTVPVLARSLRVITYDNRGVGRSRARLHDDRRAPFRAGRRSYGRPIDSTER